MTRKSQSSRDCSHLSEHILYEPALTLDERPPDTTAGGTMFSRIFLKLRKAVRIEVRTGYQDETGFHSGIKPAENEIQWPPVW
ncbi:MAG: hypothetical protein WBS33_19655 [Verrucomicrobiia bacterium]